jgi:hypothetical protein
MMPSGTTEELPAIEVQPELFKFTHLLRFWIRPWNLRRKRRSVVPGNDPGNTPAQNDRESASLVIRVIDLN